jgi:hypothetical protein
MAILMWGAMGLKAKNSPYWNWPLMLVASLTFLPVILWAGNTSNPRPRIFLEYSTRRIPLEVGATRMWLDGQEIRTGLEILPTEVSYTPVQNLELGEHRVKVLLQDQSGEQREESWTFVVQAQVEEVPWRVSFVSPSPQNGSVLSVSPEALSIKVEQSPIENLKCELWHSENGAGYKKWPWPPKNKSSEILYALSELEDGAHSFEARVRNIQTGQEQRLQSSFVVDRLAPRMEALVFTPDPFVGNQDLSVHYKVLDPPWLAIKRLKLVIEGDAGRKAEIELKHLKNEGDLHFKWKQFKDWPEGWWPVKVDAEDYAGHVSGLPFPQHLRILSSEAQLLGDDIRLEAYPTITSKLSTSLRGQSLAYYQIAVFINGERRALRANSAELVDGEFAFDQLALSPGLNEISLQLYDGGGRPFSEPRLASPILVDIAAPECHVDFPLEAAQVISPLPELKFKVIDRVDKELDFTGVGCRTEDITVTCDGVPWKCHIDGDRVFAQGPEPLSLGEHSWRLVAKDRLGWSMETTGTFKIVAGEPKKMLAELDRKEVYADSYEQVQVRIQLKDEFDRPVVDGTLVKIKASQGLVTEQVHTVGGEAEVVYIPGIELGQRTLSIQYSSGQLEKNLTLMVLSKPNVEVFSAKLQLSSPELVADGSSQLTLQAELYDAQGQLLPDGIGISLKTSLGQLEPSFVKTQKGSIVSNLKSGGQTGTAVVQLNHLNFHKEVKVEFVAPPLGPAEKLKLELWPPTALAGSALPLRLTVQVKDRFGRDVADGTLVNFSVDKGWIKSSARTVGGQVLNNVVAPDQAGQIRLRVKVDNVEEMLDIKVDERAQDESAKVQQIEVLSAKSFEQGKSIHIHGRLLNGQKVQILNDTLLWISYGASKFRTMARAGLFEWKSENGFDSDILFHLESESVSVDWPVGITPLSKSNVQDESVALDSKERSLLDVDYQLDRQEGDLRMGILLVRELNLQGQLIKRERAEVVEVSSFIGVFPAKAYLVGGEARIPFQYKAMDQKFMVEVSMGGDSAKIDFPAERLPQLVYTEKNLPQMTPLAQDAEADTVEVDLPTEEVSMTDPVVWDIQRGLQFVRLSGRLDLEAGGRDQTRLRYRLLDNMGEDLPDGTEVEVQFEQAKVRPHFVKVKRGQIQFQLQTTDWVGSYPLQLKVGQVEVEETVRIRAPKGGDVLLPGLPGSAGGERRKWRSN